MFRERCNEVATINNQANEKMVKCKNYLQEKRC